LQSLYLIYMSFMGSEIWEINYSYRQAVGMGKSFQLSNTAAVYD